VSGGPPPPGPRKYLERELDGPARELYDRLAAGELATTSCPGCGLTEFPPRSRCPRCGAETTWVELPRHGRLHAFTTQETALRFAAPAVLALAELGPAVLPGICEAPYDELAIGDPVEVRLLPEPETGLTVLVFVPDPGGSAPPARGYALSQKPGSRPGEPSA
jgi:uncharacterized OB-fold protein